MSDDDSRGKPAGDRPGHAPTTNRPADTADGDRRREPVFTTFDEDEDYEESERDTDYASTYEDEEEEYLDPLEDDETEIVSADWQVLGSGTAAAADRSREASRNPWAEKEPGDGAGELESEGFDDASDTDLFDEEDDAEDLADDEPEDDWDNLEEYTEEPEEFEPGQADRAQGWPLGMIIVGLVALLLLAAGGYGVIQQRAATEEEIRQLQAALATAGSPAELAASKEALREMELRVADNQAAMDDLVLENRRLADTVAGLEKQLAAQQATALKAPDPKPARAAAPPAPAKAAAKPASAAAAPGGDWFVNFSSYTQRSAAESWVRKLKPSAGKALVVAGSKDGQTFYRVRIVGLADRAQAQGVAAQLQSTHNLPPLWVGRE